MVVVSGGAEIMAIVEAVIFSSLSIVESGIALVVSSVTFEGVIAVGIAVVVVRLDVVVDSIVALASYAADDIVG